MTRDKILGIGSPTVETGTSDTVIPAFGHAAMGTPMIPAFTGTWASVLSEFIGGEVTGPNGHGRSVGRLKALDGSHEAAREEILLLALLSATIPVPVHLIP